MLRRLYQHDPQFGYRFVPGLRTRVEHEGGGYLIRVNEAGFRCDHEFKVEKDPGRFRALLFGDSYTAGDAVSNKARYGDQLEKLVPGLEIYNFGMSGTGTDQQYLIYEHVAKKYDHDLVIIAVLVENIRRIVAQYRQHRGDDGRMYAVAKPFFTLEQDQLRLHNVPVPATPVPVDELPPDEDRLIDRGGNMQLLRRAVSRLGPGAKRFAQAVTGYQPLPAYQRRNHPDWQLMRAILLRWIGVSTRPVVIMPIPLYHYIEELSSPAAYQERFRELAAESGACLHDPLPDFHQLPKQERRDLRFSSDPHPTPVAHEILAKSLARTIAPMVH